MISRRTREETQEVSSTVKRRDLNRGIKRRGILPSFGDIVLPIVSVAAVCLLVLAGRQFFINGTKTSPEVTSTRAYADAPALIAEREQEEKLMPPVAKVTPAPDEESFSQPEEEVLPAISETLAQAQPAKDVNVKSSSAPKKTTASSTQKKASTTTTTAKATPAKATSLPKEKQWRVQVGAYGTKQAAQEAAKKIKAAGYKSEVYSNPASKHVKVWVYSGGDKSAALRVVEAMKKLGYKSSFAFPPAK